MACKETATVFTGEQLFGRWYRELEEKLATAQRARQRGSVKAIHAKVAKRRKDALHKFSRTLLNENAATFVGKVNSQTMVRSRMRKSSLDACWGMLKSMLEYK